MNSSVHYWVNIKGCGWVEVGLLEYQRIDKAAKNTGARLTGAPDVNSFCYGKDGMTTQGRILKPESERYTWDQEFQAALAQAA